MSLSKRWLETLPEFDVDVDVDVDVDIILEEELTDEDTACWPQWFEGNDEYCIEADYEFIRRGC